MVRSFLFFSFFLNCINLIFMHFKKSSLISVLFIRKNCDWVVIYVGHWYASTWKYSGIQVSRTVLDAVITFVTYQECSHSPEFQLSCLCFRSVCMFSYAFACLCVDTQLKFLPFASVCARTCVRAHGCYIPIKTWPFLIYFIWIFSYLTLHGRLVVYSLPPKIITDANCIAVVFSQFWSAFPVSFAIRITK